jgi:hypothetical protein
MNGIDDALPVTTLLPATAAEPVIMFDPHAALRSALVERSGASLLSEEWNAPGVYILLDLPQSDGTWGCYVGKATSPGLRQRLRSHLRQKDHWRRALLIQRDTTHGFNSAQVAWLEGRLYDLLDASEDARLHNGNRPSDETLPAFERTMLEAAVLPISRILRLIGYDPYTADDSTALATVAARRTSRFYGITLKQIIDAGYLRSGATLTSTNTVWPASGTVNADGTLTVDGQLHPTPSAAASAVKLGAAANGWDFWAIDTQTGKVSLATLRARYVDDQPTQQNT